MPVKFGFRGSLLRCGRCGQRYSNPITHVCVSSTRQSRPTRLQPGVSITLGKCGTCGKPMGNPVTHTCSGGGDFAGRRRAQARAKARAKRKEAADARRKRERLAAARKSERDKADARVARAKAGRRKGRSPRPGQGHDYRRCRDSDCMRPACLAYAEGLAEGLRSDGRRARRWP